jgi:hypothetical protein
VDTGLLWFDNDPKLDVLRKVQKAAAYYKHKYGEEPNLCFVHPSMMKEGKTNSGSVVVCSNTTTLPNHFWIGVHYSEATNP